MLGTFLSEISTRSRAMAARAAVLAVAKEYDHVLQPISAAEYMFAAILRIIAPPGLAQKLAAKKIGELRDVG